MTRNEIINSLCWIIINSASQGYVSSNDLDFANECLDKVQAAQQVGGASESQIKYDVEQALKKVMERVNKPRRR